MKTLGLLLFRLCVLIVVVVLVVVVAVVVVVIMLVVVVATRNSSSSLTSSTVFLTLKINDFLLVLKLSPCSKCKLFLFG